MTRTHTSLIALVVAGATIAGCSAKGSDYRKEAEKFIQSDDFAKQAGYSFTDATCEDPGTTATGTQYSCEAVDSDGDRWQFTVEITGKNELTVVDAGLI